MGKLLVLFLLLVGCQKEAQEAKYVGNYNVELLFTNEGCRVYRFYDGRTVYYANCSEFTTTHWDESCGKNCVRATGVQSTKKVTQ